MTQTTNIGLKKIDGSENWRQIFDYHNDSMDKADSSVAAVQDGLAIVANGNTHAAVAEGQFVYVRNHSTLAEGLYKATDAIATNGELTTSNLTADGSGGLNDLQGQVDSLNSNFTQIAIMSGLASPNSWTELAQTLLDKANQMGINSWAHIFFYVNFTDDIFTMGATPAGAMYINAKGSGYLYFTANLVSTAGDNIVLAYQNGTWLRHKYA